MTELEESPLRHPTGDDDDNFTLKEIAPDVFLCREKYYMRSWNVANLYVVRGQALDLIIDTGIGIWDLPSFLREKLLVGANGKPYQAVATHVHFDHAGGLHQFKEFAIHRLEADAIRKGDSFEACCFLTDSDCGKKPSKDWKARDYKLRSANPTRVLEDGDTFDLGDKTIQVLHVPGHSRGSICLVDEENGHLFSGDAIWDGPALDCLPYGNVEDCIQSMETFEALASKVKRVFPGHGDAFDGTKLKALASDYLKNAGVCHDCTACIVKPIAALLIKGRNTSEMGPRCCYYSCCCCFMLGPPASS